MKKTVTIILALMLCILIAACGKSAAETPAAQAPAAEVTVSDGDRSEDGGLDPEIAKAYLAEVDELAAHLGFSEDEGLQDEYLHGGFITDWDGDGIPEMCLLMKTSPRENNDWSGTPLYGWNAPTFYLYRFINGQAARVAACDLYFATAGREAEVAALKTGNGMQAVWFDRDDTTGSSYAVCFEFVNGTIERKEAPADMAEAAEKAENAEAFFGSFGEEDVLPLLYNYSGDARIEIAANARELRQALANTAGTDTEIEVLKPPEPAFDPDSYLGYYTNNGYDTVEIGKNGDGYTMIVSIYRLTTIDEGTVSFTSDGVVFNALDGTGQPIKFTFYSTGNGRYAFRVDETTWPLLHAGEVFSDLVKTERGDA